MLVVQTVGSIAVFDEISDSEEVHPYQQVFSVTRYSLRFVLATLIHAVLLFAFPTISLAQGKPTPVAVHLGASVELNGAVKGGVGMSYTVHADAGQHLHLALKAAKGATLFNVYAPGTGPGDEAIFRGDVGGNTAVLDAKQAGDYRIDVFQMRSAARRGTVSSFTLTVGLKP